MVNKNIKWGENVIELNEFIKIINECENRFPLLTLDEFFSENKVEDSIAPNQCGFGRPSLAEIWDMFKKVEAVPNVAWVRVALHDDTDIVEHNGKNVLELWGDSIVVCTSLRKRDLEKLVNCEWLCSGGAEEINIFDLDNLFSCRPIVPEGFRCFEIVWD